MIFDPVSSVEEEVNVAGGGIDILNEPVHGRFVVRQELDRVARQWRHSADAAHEGRCGGLDERQIDG